MSFFSKKLIAISALIMIVIGIIAYFLLFSGNPISPLPIISNPKPPSSGVDFTVERLPGILLGQLDNNDLPTNLGISPCASDTVEVKKRLEQYFSYVEHISAPRYGVSEIANSSVKEKPIYFEATFQTQPSTKNPNVNEQWSNIWYVLNCGSVNFLNRAYQNSIGYFSEWKYPYDDINPSHLNVYTSEVVWSPDEPKPTSTQRQYLKKEYVNSLKLAQLNPTAIKQNTVEELAQFLYAIGYLEGGTSRGGWSYAEYKLLSREWDENENQLILKDKFWKKQAQYGPVDQVIGYTTGTFTNTILVDKSSGVVDYIFAPDESYRQSSGP